MIKKVITGTSSRTFLSRKPYISVPTGWVYTMKLLMTFFSHSFCKLFSRENLKLLPLVSQIIVKNYFVFQNEITFVFEKIKKQFFLK